MPAPRFFSPARFFSRRYGTTCVGKSPHPTACSPAGAQHSDLPSTVSLDSIMPTLESSGYKSSPSNVAFSPDEPPHTSRVSDEESRELVSGSILVVGGKFGEGGSPLCLQSSGC